MTEVKILPQPSIVLELGSRIETSALTSDAAGMVRDVVERELEGRLDHRVLPGREEESQHPIRAIEGLAEEIRKIPAPAEAITNFELEELLK